MMAVTDDIERAALEPVEARAPHVVILHAHPERRSLLENQLSKILPGVRISEAEDARSAVRIMSANKADLIVAEQAGRSGDGEELVQTLRRNSVLARKPVLLLASPGVACLPAGDPYLRTLEENPEFASLRHAVEAFMAGLPGKPASPAQAEAAPSSPLILVLSNGNACRGPLSQALLQRSMGASFRVESCGHRAGQLHPAAVSAAQEAGLNISAHQPRSLRETKLEGLAMTINLCFGEPGPIVPGRHKRLDWPTPDPLKGAAEGMVLLQVRKTRDLLVQRVEKLANEMRMALLG